MSNECGVKNAFYRFPYFAFLGLYFLMPALAKEIPKARPEEVGLSSERLARIRTTMQRYIDRGEVAGVVTLVARRGRIAYVDAVGMRDLAARKPMNVDTIFWIASMTKPITSVAAMMLYEQGHFLLTDPVSKFIPEFKNPKVAVAPKLPEFTNQPFFTVPAEREITIHDLLTHTAGLANSRGLASDLYRKMQAEAQPNDTIGDIVKRLAKIPLKFQPGSAWDYGAASDVLGYLVEIISGLTLDQFFQERIFRPLGMNDTHFYLPEEKLSRRAVLYAPAEKGGLRPTDLPRGPADSGTVAGVTRPKRYYGGGGLLSTVTDYLRFHQMMLNAGELDGVRLLGRKTVELMTTNHIRDLPMTSTPEWRTTRWHGFRFGLGYRVRADLGESALPGSLGSYGWEGSGSSYFWVDPKEQMVGILMCQVFPYPHLNIRFDFQVLANAAIADQAEKKETSE